MAAGRRAGAHQRLDVHWRAEAARARSKPLPWQRRSWFFLASIPNSSLAKNKGLEAYEREDYTGAQEQFSTQLKRLPESQALEFDLGAAAYKAGDFGKALESFAKAVTSPTLPLREASEYNIGNTLYQRGAGKRTKSQKSANGRMPSSTMTRRSRSIRKMRMRSIIATSSSG